MFIEDFPCIKDSVYIDDGYSGTNFQRPSFQAILTDINVGKIGTVIVKDISRLRQNYLQVGMHTEMIFLEKGVCFIAINGGVDSAQGDNDFVLLWNIFNEWLMKDASKKIKTVKRSKGMSGNLITSKPVYGYLMDGDENFIISEEAALVFRQIYSLCLVGNECRTKLPLCSQSRKSPRWDAGIPQDRKPPVVVT